MARSFVAASSQYILVNSAPSINLGSGDFAVLAWVRFPTIPPNSSMIIGKRQGGFDGDTGWELKFDNAANGDVRFDVDTDSVGRQRTEVDIPTLVDGAWHLLGCEHTEGTPAAIRIWFDGAIVSQNTVATPGSVDTATPLVIGAAYNTPSLTNFLTGQIGPVFVCNRALSLAEHQYLARGFAMNFLRPRPCFLMPMISRGGGNEPDIVGGLLGGLGNAPAIVDNPRIIYPVGARIGQDLWYEQAQATISGQSNCTAKISRNINRTATVSAQAALTATLSANVAPLAAVAAQSSLTVTMSQRAAVGATIRAQSALIAPLSAQVPVSTAIAGQSGVTATIKPRVSVAAQADGQSAITANGQRLRGLATAIAGQSALTSAITVQAKPVVQIGASSSLTAFLSGTVRPAATIGGQSNLVARPRVKAPIAAALTGQSALTVTMTRAQSVAAAVAGQSALTAAVTAFAPLAATIAASSSLTASLSATVPVATTVEGQSALAVLPTYPGERKTITVGGYIRWLEKAGGQPI